MNQLNESALMEGLNPGQAQTWNLPEETPRGLG